MTDAGEAGKGGEGYSCKLPRTAATADIRAAVCVLFLRSVTGVTAIGSCSRRLIRQLGAEDMLPSHMAALPQEEAPAPPAKAAHEQQEDGRGGTRGKAWPKAH